MATSAATARLRKEFKRIQADPVQHIEAAPCEDNILEWHYVVRGPPQSFYAGGIYHGKLNFPRDYPYKPPAIYMITPNGRFKTNTRLCLSMSDFHPESWNPLWSVSSILSGLLSFMLETSPTYGSVDTSDAVKSELARRSLDFNLKDSTFNKLFPHYQETKLVNEANSALANNDEHKEADDQPESALGNNNQNNTKTNNNNAKVQHPLLSPTAGAATINSPTDNPNANANTKRSSREQDLYDTFLMIGILATLLFALSYLYI